MHSKIQDFCIYTEIKKICIYTRIQDFYIYCKERDEIKCKYIKGILKGR